MALHSKTINILSLCSGIGGLDIGTARALRTLGSNPRTVCYVEREAFSASVLVKAMQRKELDEAPIWSNIKTFDCEPWQQTDLVIGGFPCQPFSFAGRGEAAKDPRHLWPEVLRVLAETKARFAFLENVPGLVRRGLRDVIKDLSSIGFDVEWDLFSAQETGAPHRRERLFILANTNSKREPQPQRSKPNQRRRAFNSGEESPTSNTKEPRLSRLEPSGEKPEQSRPSRCGWWDIEPRMGRVADGIPDRTHRLRALGNAVVPQTAELAFLELWERMNVSNYATYPIPSCSKISYIGDHG